MILDWARDAGHSCSRRLTQAVGFRPVAGAPAAIGILLSFSGCSGDLPASYVRVTAHLMHGDEPVTMDWIVECRSFRRGGEMRGYIGGTVVPYVYGVTTRDGGMVMAVAPRYCGVTPPPPGYVPLFFWGDKAGDFSFLTAYATEDAFNNPSSKIKVIDVKLTPSTAAERGEWKKTGVKNIVPAQHNPFLRNAGMETDELRIGCGAFERTPVGPSVQGHVDAEWPPDHPRYWRNTSPLAGRGPEDFYKVAHSDSLIREDSRLALGEGIFKHKIVNLWLDASGNPVQAELFQIAPIDFDFFHQPVDEFTISGKYRTLKRPVSFIGKVDVRNTGMMYCGFFPTLFGAVDTKFRFDFPDGTVEGVSF